ncbi:hypothetical protein GCM10009733_005710 [Nonomuraea maheshkhaliensis]|uniref:Uncharacterized protein n=1 Tax=Nonomuraea maheshkhaliensis TaxID=419590 RepID=A0ABN2EPS5_9ACTN
MMTTDSTVRAEFIAGLRALARFLADNPKVPVPSYGETVSVHASGTERQQHAKVDRVAELIGAPTSGGTHYQTARDFGPITYRAIAISEQAMNEYTAALSYQGAVTT